MNRYLLMALLIVNVVFATSKQSYQDVNGTGGLVITAFRQAQCTGTPPSVTPNGGATQFVFSHLGSGLYECDLIPEGHYYLFQGAGFTSYKGIYYQPSDSALVLLSTIMANSWVTATRIATGAVTSAKILDGTIAAADYGASSIPSSALQSLSVTGAKLAVGAVGFAQCASSFVGSGYDASFQIDEMQKILRAAVGAWDSTTGYDMGQLDSLMKKLVLNLAYSSPGITLSFDAGNLMFGLDLNWDQSGGSAAHNDSATAEYQIWVGTSAPAITLPGTLDASEQATLANSMSLHSTITRPSYNGQSRFVGFGGTIYALVVGIDWQGTQYGSAVVSGVASGGDIGQTSSLNGGYLYADQPLMNYVKDIANKMQTIEAVSTSVAKKEILLHAAGTVAAAGYDQQAAALPVYRSAVLEASSKDQVLREWIKQAGYTKATAIMNARCERIGDKGYIELNVGGYKNQVTVGGLGTATDTVTQEYSVTVNFGGLTDGQLYDVTLGGWASTTDTLIYWGEVIVIE